MAKGRETFRKIITSPEILEQVNSKNEKLADRFLKNFATKRSPNSVINYRSNLNIFFAWNVIEGENKFFVDLKKRDFMDFFDYCVTELKWNSNRFCQMHSTLSSFSSWIENFYDEEYPTFRNLLPKIEKPVKENVRKKSVFTQKEIDDLMHILGEDNRIQEQCLLALLISSGSRASELARFTTTIIDENNIAFDGLFLETTEEIRTKGRGINGKMLIRYILKDTFLPYYKKWLPIREKIMKENNVQHNYIFITQNGEPAGVPTFRAWVERWNNYLDKPLYLHSMRHFYTTKLLMTLEPELVQNIVGWNNLDMLSVYNDATAKDKKWKGLSKLKDALEKEKENQNS